MKKRRNKVKSSKKTVKEIFGSLKDWKIDTQKFKDELRKEWK